jgi:very-short-patch-repair endonuclease
MRHGVDMPRPKHTRLARTRAHKLRNDLTISEARLWSGIKNRATGARFRRQVPIGPWIADFACLDLKIIVEVDDSSHHWRDETDRTAYLESKGFGILRLSNHEVAAHLDDAIDAVALWVEHVKKTDRHPDW